LSYTRRLSLQRNDLNSSCHNASPTNYPQTLKPKPETLVEGEGFEPSKAEPSDLQSDPFDRSGTPPNRTRNYANQRLGCQTELAYTNYIMAKI
jgi:hypothetical protein